MEVGGGVTGGAEGLLEISPLAPTQALSPHISPEPFIRPRGSHTEKMDPLCPLHKVGDSMAGTTAAAHRARPPTSRWPPSIHSGGGGERVRFCLGPLRLLLCSLSESLQPIPVVPDPALLARLACPAPGHVRREWLGDGRVLGGLISQPDAGSPTGMSTDPLVPGSRQQSHGW